MTIKLMVVEKLCYCTGKAVLVVRSNTTIGWVSWGMGWAFSSFLEMGGSVNLTVEQMYSNSRVSCDNDFSEQGAGHANLEVKSDNDSPVLVPSPCVWQSDWLDNLCAKQIM